MSRTTQADLWSKTQHWIENNPVLYALFEKYAVDKAAQGHNFGIGQLAERVRWDGSYGSNGKSEFKIPNECRRYIAIQIYEDHPEVESFCTTPRGSFVIPTSTPLSADQDGLDFVGQIG